MAEYEDLDEATLQQKLSDATSYEERATLRQILRKRKKERGETSTRSKPRGNSVYNRFAGSTVTKTPAKSGGGVMKSGPPSSKQQDGPASAHHRESPTPRQPSTPTVQPVVTPPSTPEPVQTQPDSQSNEVDGTPVTTEPAEDEQSQSPAAPLHDDTQDGVEEEPDLGITEKPASPEPEPVQVELARDTTDAFEHKRDPIPASANLHKYFVAYVNQELFLDPPLPNRGKALFDTCSDPTSLCKLINKSVPGTVDMRALSKVSGSSSQRAEAMQDNMTLALESARAIGCHIDDTTADKILCKDPETINSFLLDLVRARVVHMPGMEDEPSSTFTDLDSLFQKLHISVDEEPVSRRDDPDKVRKALKTPPSKESSWKDAGLTYEERAALRKAEREQRQKEKEAKENSVGLTYEERSTQRKAERESRRKEREALAK